MRLIARLLGRSGGQAPRRSDAEGNRTPGERAALDSDLRELLRRHINSPVKMDLVAYLHDNPYALDAVRSLGTRLGRDASLLEACAGDLVRDGLLVEVGGGAPGSPRVLLLAPGGETRDQVGRLVRLYREGDPDGVRAAIRDCSIADAVRSVVMGSTLVSAIEIALCCEGGRVTLAGRVNTPDEHEELARICRRLSQSRYGIRGLENRVVVEPRPHAADAETAARVRTALAERLSPPSVARGEAASRVPSPVDVACIGGVAYLTGTIQSAQDRSRVAQVAQEVAGVADVVNRLEAHDERGRERRDGA